MKKSISVLMIFFIAVFASYALATTVSLSTYYPAPTSAYKQINITPNGAAPNCGLASNNGAIFADTSGTLYVCNNGSQNMYPQECINLFCSYDTTVLSACATPSAGPTGWKPVASATDTFHASADTMIVSTVWCSP